MQKESTIAPYLCRYAGGKKARKKKRRSATVFYSDESDDEDEEGNAKDRKKALKKFSKVSTPKRASTGKKGGKKGAAAQLSKLERRTTSSSDLAGIGGDGQGSGEASEAVADAGVEGNTEFGIGNAELGGPSTEEVNLAAFAEVSDRAGNRVSLALGLRLG